MESSGGSEVKPAEWGPQTHRGAEWGNPPVTSTDGQVIESDGFPVQLHVLPDPQHALHRRDQKLPWVPPRGPESAGNGGGSPGLSPVPLASLTCRGWGTPGTWVLQCPQLQTLMGPANAWEVEEAGEQITAG